MTNFLFHLHRIVWGVPALVLILGTGIFLCSMTRFVQVRLFPTAVRELIRRLRQPSRDGVSSFQAFCTALAATVGTGNLVGVAGAICLGGPGAVFWMWVCGLLGMGTKFAEVTLALYYRVPCGKEFLGGPMYMIRRGMGEKWKGLAAVYAAFGIVASFGVGNAAQISALITAVGQMLENFRIPQTASREFGVGLLLAVAVGITLFGGAIRIGRTAEMLIPAVSVGYIGLCLAVLVIRRQNIPMALRFIIQGAFSPQAATGGLLGSSLQALRVGCSRGVFTNEAGMGTASMAHASANVSHPAAQGLLGIVEVFLDTIVICTMTALVILVSGVSIPYGTDIGAALTLTAFSSVLGKWVNVFLAAALACFAFATVLGWGLYGARCAQYLFGPGAWRWFSMLQILCVLLSSVAEPAALWLLAETVNGAMAIPNLIALVALAPQLRRITIDYERKSGADTPVEVPYANFHQRQPLRALSHAQISSAGCGRKESRQKDLPSEHWPA